MFGKLIYEKRVVNFKINEMKKSIILFFSSFLLCIFSYSQNLNPDQLKPVLKTSTLAVFSAQKLLLSKEKKQAEGNLSKAVFCQLKAIELFKEKKFEESYCYSLFSRELSNEIITTESGNLNPNYKLSEEDIKNKSGCKNTTDFFLAFLETRIIYTNINYKDIN